jgi:hypothetical protein
MAIKYSSLCLIAVGLLAMPATSWSQVQIIEPRPGDARSPFSRNDRNADELDRARMTGRHTHRGWEVRNDRGVYIATTSLDDARRAAAIVGETWGTMNRFADNFTEIHQHPDFGLGSIQVFIDDQPPKLRDEPIPVWNPGAFENRILLNTSEGRPDLAKQIPVLRAAVAYSYLHVSELDKLFPEWVTDGLAQAAVLRHEGVAGLDAIAKVPDGMVRGDQWKRLRGVVDRLDPRAPQAEQAAAPNMVPYALFGNDGVQAPAFFAALGRTLQAKQGEVAYRANQVVRRRQLIVDQQTTTVDELGCEWTPEFQNWSQDPDAFVPQFSSEHEDDREIYAQERQLFVILKLAQRLLADPEEAVKPKFVEFKVQQARRDRRVTRPIKPVANEAETPQQPVDDAKLTAKKAKVQGVNTIADLLTTLNDRNGERPWAIVDMDGSLLVSQNRQRLQQFLGNGENYRAAWEKDRWVWSTNLDDGRQLTGWLEPIQKDEPYLVARFEVKRSK